MTNMNVYKIYMLFQKEIKTSQKVIFTRLPVRQAAWKPETYETSSFQALLKTSFQVPRTKSKKRLLSIRPKHLVRF